MKVSALILTCNHERFIGDALEGFLRQKTNSPCELIVADDRSTDGTRDVIRRYWEKCPDRIQVLLNRHNIGPSRTFARAYQACRGQYVATVDGDDYWTCADKLQRQADLLDRHPDWAMCFHSVRMVWDDGSREPVLYHPPVIKETYTLRELLQNNFIGSCSTMYRKAVVREFPGWYYHMPVGDWCHHVLFAEHGAVGYIDEPMGVYRQHDGGIYSIKPARYKLRVGIEMLRRFRCLVAREHRGVIDHALYKYYRLLVHHCCDEDRQGEARRYLAECLREVGPSLHVSLRDLLGMTIRVYAPAFHARCRRLCSSR